MQFNIISFEVKTEIFVILTIRPNIFSFTKKIHTKNDLHPQIFPSFSYLYFNIFVPQNKIFSVYREIRRNKTN